MCTAWACKRRNTQAAVAGSGARPSLSFGAKSRTLRGSLHRCMSGCRTLVFGRYPAPGRVKTRLASSVGADAACTFYSACLAHTVAQASAWLRAEHDTAAGAACSVALCYSDSGDGEALQRWLSEQQLGDVELVAQVQHTQDLGCRMRAALAHGLAQPGVDRALILGSDVPGLSADVVRDAARALASCDVVFGPSSDGGYYLVGLRGASALGVLFTGVQWSSPTVLAVSLALAQKAGLRVAPLHTLPTLTDVDVVEDLHAFLLSAEAGAHPLHSAARAALEAGRTSCAQ